MHRIVFILLCGSKGLDEYIRRGFQASRIVIDGHAPRFDLKRKNHQMNMINDKTPTGMVRTAL